jgi:hypothetical protein
MIILQNDICTEIPVPSMFLAFLTATKAFFQIEFEATPGAKIASSPGRNGAAQIL